MFLFVSEFRFEWLFSQGHCETKPKHSSSISEAWPPHWNGFRGGGDGVPRRWRRPSTDLIPFVFEHGARLLANPPITDPGPLVFSYYKYFAAICPVIVYTSV